MKVISSPDIDNWKEKCKCHICSSMLEIDSSDVLHKIERRYESYGDPWDGGSYHNYDCYYIVCPMCKKEVTINTNGMPYLLKEKVKEKSTKKK